MIKPKLAFVDDRNNCVLGHWFLEVSLSPWSNFHCRILPFSSSVPPQGSKIFPIPVFFLVPYRYSDSKNTWWYYVHWMKVYPQFSQVDEKRFMASATAHPTAPDSCGLQEGRSMSLIQVLRWFGHLVRIPPERLTQEECLTGRRPQGRPRNDTVDTLDLSAGPGALQCSPPKRRWPAKVDKLSSWMDGWNIILKVCFGDWWTSCYLSFRDSASLDAPFMAVLMSLSCC